MVKPSRKRRSLAADLTDDLIVEILSLLPVRSLFRSKCVSRRWHFLIPHRDYRRRLPQTLAGFFYRTVNFGSFPEEARHFTNVFERRRGPLINPSFSFMPEYEHISILDSSNGLLHCCHSEISSHNPLRYVVCNPATERWVVLPDSGCGSESRVARLGFDPAVSSHYHVFEFVENDHESVAGAEIYSSETGAWMYKESEWNFDTTIFRDAESVFFSGVLHIAIIEYAIVALDVKGETWWMLTVPEEVSGTSDWEPGFLGRYQGHLCYINDSDSENDLSIWVLEDYATYDWIMKHHVSIEKLTEKKITPPRSYYYHVIAIHPDCNMIIYVFGWGNTLMAYNIGREEVHAIQNLGSDCWLPYTPYVPFYSDSWINGH